MRIRRKRLGAVWCGLAVALLLPAAPVTGQSGGFTPVARTTWGDPDLQGIWNFGTLTPMERPESLAGTARLTEEEAAALRAAACRGAGPAEPAGRGRVPGRVLRL